MIVSLCALLFGSAAGAADAPIVVDEVIRAGIARAPALRAADADVARAEGALRAAAGLRYDPSVDVRVGFGLQQHELAINQPISLSGEGVAAVAAARAGLRAAEASRDRARLEAAAGARLALIRAIAAEAEAARAAEVLALATTLRDAADQRLAAGEANALDAHMARLEASAAAAELARARRAAVEAREALAALAGVDAAVALPEDPMVAAPPAGVAAPRADLAAAQAARAAAVARLGEARAAALPPVTLGVWAQVQNVGVVPGVGGVTLDPWSWSENAAWTVGPSLSMTLPVWNGNQAGVAAAAADRDEATAVGAAAEARVAAEAGGAAGRRAILAALDDGDPPGGEARAALAAIDAASRAGERSPAEAALLRARVLDAWGRAAQIRAEVAEVAVELALSESWATLVP
jgi:outer membrane protein TolC